MRIFTITKIKETKSYHTGKMVNLVTFKGDDGKSYRTWIDPKNGNYRKWAGVLTPGINVTGLVEKGKGLIDADSTPKVVKTAEPEVVNDWPPEQDYRDEEGYF